MKIRRPLKAVPVPAYVYDFSRAFSEGNVERGKEILRQQFVRFSPIMKELRNSSECSLGDLIVGVDDYGLFDLKGICAPSERELVSMLCDVFELRHLAAASLLIKRGVSIDYSAYCNPLGSAVQAACKQSDPSTTSFPPYLELALSAAAAKPNLSASPVAAAAVEAAQRSILPILTALLDLHPLRALTAQAPPAVSGHVGTPTSPYPPSQSPSQSPSRGPPSRSSSSSSSSSSSPSPSRSSSPNGSAPQMSEVRALQAFVASSTPATAKAALLIASRRFVPQPHSWDGLFKSLTACDDVAAVDVHVRDILRLCSAREVGSAVAGVCKSSNASFSVTMSVLEEAASLIDLCGPLIVSSVSAPQRRPPSGSSAPCALTTAADNGNIHAVVVLLALGVPPDGSDPSCTPLARASQSRFTHAISPLLAAGADPTVTRRGGLTPLHDVVAGMPGKDQSGDVVSQLVEYGADVNALCDKGLTPLMIGRAVWMTALLQAGANADATRRDTGATALMVHAEAGNDAQVALLLRHGASVAMTDRLGRSVVHVASTSAILLLYALVVDIDTEDADGLTPLQRAVDMQNSARARLLLSLGANVNVLWGDGTTVATRMKTMPSGYRSELLSTVSMMQNMSPR